MDELRRILISDLPAHFLLEVMLRTTFMFLVILLALRTSGKRSIRQLSIFELVIIIGLGSAAGDPMFYEDVGLLPALTVFFIVIILYLSVTWLSDKFSFIEKLLEGRPIHILQDGQILTDNFRRSRLSLAELFAGLRQANVEHLGQVRTVIMETTGSFSILFFEDEEVKYGLPIFPAATRAATETAAFPADHNSCTHCGYTHLVGGMQEQETNHCPACKNDCWIPSIATRRIS